MTEPLALMIVCVAMPVAVVHLLSRGLALIERTP